MLWLVPLAGRASLEVVVTWAQDLRGGTDPLRVGLPRAIGSGVVKCHRENNAGRIDVLVETAHRSLGLPRGRRRRILVQNNDGQLVSGGAFHIAIPVERGT